MKTKNKVFLNGCFDVLHVGHFKLITHCKMLAGEEGELIIALDSDRRVKQMKGGDRPIFTLEERIQALNVIKPAFTTIFRFDTDEDLRRLIAHSKPDFLVVGADWRGKPVIGADLAKVVYFPRVNISSTEIIEKIIQNHQDYLDSFHEGIKRYE